MAKPVITQRMLNWMMHQKKLGHEVRQTKNGHPYAAIRTGARRLPKSKAR